VWTGVVPLLLLLLLIVLLLLLLLLLLLKRTRRSMKQQLQSTHTSPLGTTVQSQPWQTQLRQSLRQIARHIRQFAQ
jgi:predicted Holliday junction resolvase-like endonuclease